MRLSWTILVLMLLNQAADFAPHGTLILGISTAEGFVLCADKRVGRSTGGYTDTDTKIFPLGTNAAFMNNGTSTFISAAGQVMFDAERIVRDYFKGKQITDTRDFASVARALVAGFEGYLRQRPYAAWPATSPDQSLFQVPIFYFDSQQRMAAAVLQFKYEKRNPPIITVDGTSWPADEWESATSQVFGDVAVLKEIRDGSDTRFDDIRANKTYRMLTSDNKTPAKTLPVKEAEAYARLMIRVTNERAGLVPGARSSVSATSDCALLSANGKLAFF